MYELGFCFTRVVRVKANVSQCQSLLGSEAMLPHTCRGPWPGVKLHKSAPVCRSQHLYFFVLASSRLQEMVMVPPHMYIGG